MECIKNFFKTISDIVNPKYNLPDVVKTYPSTFMRDDRMALRSDWENVGNYLRKAINEYTKENK